MATAGATPAQAPREDRELARALLALTVTTGCVDAASYLGLGQVFTANMTGNVVLLGFGIAGADDLPVLAPIVSLVAFLAGAAAGGRIARARTGRHPALLRIAIGCETALVAGAALVAAIATPAEDAGGAYVVVALLACAMGIRTAAVRALAVPDLRTTVLTLTLAGLAADSPLGGGSGRRAPVQLGAAAAMFGGALIGALLERESVALPLAVTAVASGVTIAVYSVAKARGAAVSAG